MISMPPMQTGSGVLSDKSLPTSSARAGQENTKISGRFWQLSYAGRGPPGWKAASAQKSGIIAKNPGSKGSI